jgi:hypothetical protein
MSQLAYQPSKLEMVPDSKTREFLQWMWQEIAQKHNQLEIEGVPASDSTTTTTTRGTLNPDQRPASPATNDLFISTDFDRVFRWTGTVWVRNDSELPHGVYPLTEVPTSVGWQLCDGSTGISETNDNGTLSLLSFSSLAAGEIPTWNNNRWLRMSSSVDGAQIAETLGLGNTSTNIISPAGATLMSAYNHIHFGIVPASGAVLPYYRL